MTTRGERKRERERLLEARIERDQAAFRDAVPFTREDLEELLYRLSRLERAAEPFGHTKAWAAERGYDWQSIARALASREITSDNELLLGANPYHLFGPTPRRRAWMPIERDLFEALMDYLDRLGEQGGECDGSPRLTAQWLAEEGLPVAETLAALRALDANCDCEMANVDPEWIYPAPLQAVIDPPPPKPKMAAPKPTEYRDAAMVLPIPPKPWYVRTSSDHKAAKLVLQFGKGSGKPELRILAPEKPADERGWCRDRWLEMHLDAEVLVQGETKADAREGFRDIWEQHGREIVATEAAEYGGAPGRCYVSKGPGYPIDAGWYFLDLAGGFRVIELDVSRGRWDPFHQEVKKVLATLSAV